MACLIEDLRDSDVARWYRSIVNNGAAEAGDGRTAGRWETRQRYYRALLACIEAPTATSSLIAGTGPELRDAVVTAANAQSCSTLYTLAGPASRTAMLSQLSQCLAGDTTPRGDAIARLGAEVKVWSHWPYRAQWLTDLADAEPHGRWLAACGLVRVLTIWATDSRLLAASFHGDPPMSAVEDLVIISAGRASVGQARDVLARVVQLACGPLGATANEASEAVSGDFMRMGLAERTSFGDITGRVAEALAALRVLWPQQSPEQRRQLYRELCPEIIELAALMTDGPPERAAPRLTARCPAARVRGPSRCHPT
jgi:hypothetical protein